MEKLFIKLENCYGIKQLKHTFDFSKSRVNLIYAPNGSMKTSLANTFSRISDGEEPEEKLENEKPSWKIQIDNVNIQKDEIFVIEPFNDGFTSEHISTLLVDKKKKIEYETIYNSILELKNKLIIQLQRLSKVSKNNIEKQILEDFHVSDFYELLNDVVDNIDSSEDYKDVYYSTIMDPKVIDLLGSEDVKNNIKEYVNKYNELLEKSTYYKRGTFNPSRADNVAKTLKDQKYFDADHSLLLNGDSESIKDAKSLTEKLDKEREQIFNNKDLKAICDKISGSVKAIKEFQDLLELNPELVLDLEDINEFRKKLWLYYLKCQKELMVDLVQSYNSGKKKMKEIEQKARLEETEWFDAKEEFEKRFHVPYVIDIKDKENVILGTKNPNIVFIFTKDKRKKERTKNEIQGLKILSRGELRALYLLYVIFEVRARKVNRQRTVFVIDDIADSFDYENKYAIIEYLKEMSTVDNFVLLILTHNFDFYRTIQSRILGGKGRNNSFIVQRGNDEILLLKGGSENVCHPFDLWKSKLNENKSMLIASIPFIRNLIAYKEGTQHNDYKLLTSLLHIKIKPDTKNITIKNLEHIFQQYISRVDLEAHGYERKVIDIIYESAEDKLTSSDYTDINLDRKICLSIAIRLKAEEFMWSVVSDKSPTNGSQTGILFGRIKKEKEGDNSFKNTLRILGRVIIMTPENIHLNSFMYEPLIDMSDYHLSELYEEVKSLN